MSGEIINNSASVDYSKFNKITTFMFDVDGVFTNGDVLVTESGEMLRTMSTRDGQAVRYAVNLGYKVIIITKGLSEGVRKRFEFLTVTAIYDKLKEKTSAYEDALSKYNLTSEEILYMGDDLPDVPLMRRVGLPSCPADATPEVIEVSEYISPFNGGKGCVRDVVEKVMRCQGTWPTEKF
jgi:3-deoxy-D-manno-octulosonate 8-phosphate phosphatase (KDO 8-P phosphatase)